MISLLFVEQLISIFGKVSPQCGKSFLGLPHWYEYLNVKPSNGCVPQLTSLNDFWLIGLAVIEILLRVSIFLGIAYVIYAGIKYSESRGNVDKATSAKNTLIDAITGVIIALIVVSIISFIGGRFEQS